MSIIDRAAQFAPFAALTGYDAAIQETARLTDTAAELDESAKFALNEQLTVLQNAIQRRPNVTVLFFEDDRRKAGGAYRTVTGKLQKIDTLNDLLVLADGTSIPFSRIYQLNSDLPESQPAADWDEE
jgi:hypothetical protein